MLGFVEEWSGPDADENGRGANAVQPEPAFPALEANTTVETEPLPAFVHEASASPLAGGKTLYRCISIMPRP